MSTHVWTPGAAGPLDEFIGRLERIVTAFARDNERRAGGGDASSSSTAPGTSSPTTSPEPGFGFFSLTPHREDDDEPRQVIVPIGAVRSIDISAPDPPRPFGFVPAS